MYDNHGDEMNREKTKQIVTGAFMAALFGCLLYTSMTVNGVEIAIVISNLISAIILLNKLIKTDQYLSLIHI